MQKVIRRRSAPSVEALAGAELPPLLARIYGARGIRSREELDLGLGQLLPPDALLQADSAAALLADALALSLIHI